MSYSKGTCSLDRKKSSKNLNVLLGGKRMALVELRKNFFNYASSGYNLMQNGKADIFSDEAVLKLILNIYENDLPDIIDRQGDMKNRIDYINDIL